MKEYNELVGLVAKTDDASRRYGIDYVYRRFGTDDGIQVTIQRGFSWPRHEPFDRITNHLMDAYAPAITNVWRLKTEIGRSVYLQFESDSFPASVFLAGDWVLWAQWM